MHLPPKELARRDRILDPAEKELFTQYENRGNRAYLYARLRLVSLNGAPTISLEAALEKIKKECGIND